MNPRHMNQIADFGRRSWIVLLLAAALGSYGGRAAAATFTVTSSADTTASGTLRWAIGQANGVAGADLINFNIAGGGVKSIALLSTLPSITTTMTIDATTQPGYAGTPLIELNGSSAGAGVNGLNVTSANNMIRGLAINRFSGHGILINGAVGGSSIVQCHVGTDAAGNAALANGGTGIFVSGSPNNTIGPGNVVSGNSVDGVRLDLAASTGNVIKGNKIGTNQAGGAALPQVFNGIVVSAANSNLIGGSAAADLNVVSANTRNGVAFTAGATGNRVERNHIGVAADGISPLGNGMDGVLIIDSPGNAIGGTIAGTYNVIGANVGDGVELRGDAADNCVVQRSLIGTDLFGTQDRGNGGYGVRVDNADNAVVGIQWGNGGNLISGNQAAGIHVSNGAAGTLIRGNRIGTDFNGTAALPNSGGIVIDGGFVTGIGAVDAGNLISGNAGSGIDVITENLPTIIGNRIGVNADGSAALGNGGRGIWIRDSWNGAEIGSADHDTWTCNRACNQIAGNTSYGIQLGTVQLGPHHVRGNFIGTNASGTAALANNGAGVYTPNTYSEIGGAAAGQGNLISGNVGIGILGDGTILRIYGNRIGTNAAGSAAIGNSDAGVRLGPDKVHLELGGSAAGQGNVISGNGSDGILFQENDQFESATQNVLGNTIGTSADASACLGNGRDGLRFSSGSSFVKVGGVNSADANRFACNAGNGVTILAGTYVITLRGNYIHANQGLGIDLNGDGVTANDPGDGDDGANILSNFPTLATAINTGAATNVSGALSAEANRTYRVEFFSNPVCDASGYGEGNVYLGAVDVTTDGSGNASVSANLPPVALGWHVTSTAAMFNFSDYYYTSEFSQCIAVQSPPAAPTAGNNGPICNNQTLSLSASTVAGASYAWSGPNGFSSNLQNPSVPAASAVATGTYNVTATIGGVTSAPGSTAATVNNCAIAINDPPAVGEGTGSNPAVTFTVSLTPTSTQSLTVAWSTDNFTAFAPGDYSAASGPLTIPGNTPSVTLPITVIGDALDEEDAEAFVVNISAPSGGVIGDSQGTGNILDDDAVPVLTVDNGGCTVGEGNSGSTNCDFIYRLSTISGRNVGFTTNTAAGNAGAGDYIGQGNTLRAITAGQSTTTVSVAVLGDSLDEDNETFSLTTFGVINAALGSLDPIGTINDDDATPTLSASGCSATEGDAGLSYCNFSYTLAAPSGRTVSVSYHTEPSDNRAGVVPNGPYASFENPAISGGVQTFNAGQGFSGWSVISGEVDIVDNTVWQSAHGRQSIDLNGLSAGTLSKVIPTTTGQTYEIGFALAGNYFVGGFGCSGTLRLVEVFWNNQSLGLRSFDTAGHNGTNMGYRYERILVYAQGGLSSLRFESLTGGGCGPVIDDVTVAPASSATSGVDFAPQTAFAAGALTFAPGETSKTVAVPVLPDNRGESTEGLMLVTDAVINAAGVPAERAGTINDDDQSDVIFADGFE